MEFFMAMIPPTITHQEHKVMVRGGKPIFYEPPELRAARSKLTDAVGRYAPPEKMMGAIRLETKWIWPAKEWAWKTTRPDTDNLIKMLKDCMTKTGFWKDDAQVVSEQTEKMFGPQPGIYVKVVTI